MKADAGSGSVLHFQADAEEPARLAKVDQLEAAVAAKPSLATLAAILEALGQALHDSSPAVLKKAIPAAYVAFRPGHAAALRLGKGPQVADDVAAVWAGCRRARERVSQLLSQPGPGSDGVRMLAAKFLENTMLLLTAESSSAPKAPAAQHTLLSATLVAKEADSTVQQLVSMIKMPGMPSLPGSISIVIIKGLGSIAQQRPQYLGRILPTLLSLASNVKQPQEDGRPRASASVMRALKDALLSVLRCRAPQALTWHNKVVASMQSLGAGEIADAEVRKAERQVKRERGRDGDDNLDVKRARVEEPEQAPAPSAASWTQMPEQAQLQAAPKATQAPIAQHHVAEKPLLERLLHECPEATGVNELFMVIGVMSTLARENDLHTLQGFSGNLSPGMLADVVIANLDHIPRREDVAGAQNASSGTSALASLMQGLNDNKRPAEGAQQQQPTPQPAAMPAGSTSSLSAAAPAAQGTPRKGPLPARKLPVPNKAPKPAPKPIIKKQAPPKLKLKPLAPDQEATLRMGAVQRILASEAVPAQHLRSSVLAAIASRAPAGDSAADVVLQHILANFRQPGSYSLALQWLYSLFVAYSQADIRAEHEAAASAHVNAPQLRAALASALDDDDMAASSAAEQQPQLSLLSPEAASAKTGMNVSSTGSTGQLPDQAAARESDRLAEHAIGAEQERKNGSAAIQLAAAGEAVPMDVSQSAEELTLAVREPDMQLEGSNGEVGTSGRDHAADLSGTLYETVLLAILEGLREQISPDEKLISRLLMDSPALPHEGVMAFLRDVCSSGGDWATLALSASYDIIMKRPPSRLPALQVVLDAATGPDADIRNKAVRLVANRLYSEQSLQKAITDFAASKAKEVLPAQKPPRPALQAANHNRDAVLALPASASADEAPSQPQANSAKQAAPATAAAATAQPQHASSDRALDSSSNGPAVAAEPDLAQPKVKQETPAEDSGAGQPHQATNGLLNAPHAKQEQHHESRADSSSHADHSVDVKQETDATTAEPMQVDAPPERAAQPREGFREGSGAQAESARAAEASAADKSAVEPYREHREQPGPAAEVAAAPEQAVQVAPLSADEAAERCELLCALCTKSPGLVRLLLEVFGKAEVNARKAISRNARLLARAVGAEAPIWVDLLKRVPPKSEPLLLNMLLTLTGDAVPPRALADACMATYARLKQARFAVPALAALDRPRALSLLPKLVPLDVVAFKGAMHRLLLTQPGKGDSLLAPQEILIALLTINPQAEGLPLKAITSALTRCFEMLDQDQALVFHSQALAATMQKLIVMTPLPALFMRFVIQAVQTAPQLRSFVCEMLSTLVNKAVWTNSSQWKGWVRCVQDLVPDSLPVLLQLPVGHLEAALKELVPAVTLKAEAFLESPKCGPLPKQTQAVVRRRAAALREAAAAKEDDSSGLKKEGATKPDAAAKS